MYKYLTIKYIIIIINKNKIYCVIILKYIF